MSAAVARQQQSGHGGNSGTGSRIGSNSPVERRVKDESNKTTKSPTQNQRELQAKRSPKSSHKHSSSQSSTTALDPPQVAVDHPPDPTTAPPNASSTAVKPLNHVRPPVLPPPPGAETQERPGDDYFNFQKNRLDQEPNPFEQSFSVQSAVAQRTVLPPASAITSPAPLIGGQTYNFMNSLRSGPLSPAMLQGPISGSNPLSFDSHIRTGLTPNESGIRSGLTPGGSGSMFPVPSPSASSFLGFGGATPNTMEFQKTAITAAALKARQGQQPPPTLNPTSIPKPGFGGAPPQNEDTDSNVLDRPRQLSNAFDSDSHHAANGLYLLAQAHQQGDQYQATHAAPPPPSVAPIGPVPPGTSNMANNMRGASVMSEDMGSDSDDSLDDKDMIKGENADTPKRGGSTRRKAPDSKASSNSKRTKANTGKAMSAGGSGDDGADEEKNEKNDKGEGSSGKKMTDEEKRKNFLERNRVAALKCRQRKKQWLQNLQQKVEIYSQENESLSTQVNQLREEIVALKTLLLAHKDCPISRQSGALGTIEAIQSTLAGHPVTMDYSGHPSAAAPFGMGVMPPGVHGHPGPRRYS